MVIQNIVVIGSGIKLVITPTNRYLAEFINHCDIAFISKL